LEIEATQAGEYVLNLTLTDFRDQLLQTVYQIDVYVEEFIAPAEEEKEE